jgi:hypothetical protein
VRLTGVYPERNARVNPRWVAVWSGVTNRGKVALHVTLPISTLDYPREHAEMWALQNGGPTW